MHGPLDVSPIIDRIRVEVPDLRFVGGAADEGRIDEQRLPPMPCAMVVLEAEDHVPTKLSGGVIAQATTATVAILVGVRHQRLAERGMAHADAGQPIVAAIRGALANWRPADESADDLGTMTLAGKAQLNRLDQDCWWWIDRYQVTYRSRQEDNQ